jgi:hypothetical protein
MGDNLQNCDKSEWPLPRLYKKLLDLFLPFANISLKPNLNAVEMGYFLLQCVVFSQEMKIDGLICGEKRTVDRD